MLNVASRLLLTASLVTAAGATALAQPSATTPTTPTAPTAPTTTAPTNASWSDVSNINGQLVPVGEKNSYLYEFKRTIISTNPVGWIMGFYGVSGSYALDDHFAIRAELDYISPPNSSQSIVEADIGLPIYLRRTYQGAFLEPGFVVRQTRDSENYAADTTYGDPYGGSSTTTELGPQVLVGWHWTWESGLNVAIAAGIGRNIAHQDGDYSSDPIIANGYMRFGYAF